MKGNHVFRFFPIFDKNSLINRRKRSFLFSLSLLSLDPNSFISFILYISSTSQILCPPYENLKCTTCSFIDMHTIFATKFPLPLDDHCALSPHFQFLLFFFLLLFFLLLPACLFPLLVYLKGWHEKVRIWFSLLTIDENVSTNE